MNKLILLTFGLVAFVLFADLVLGAPRHSSNLIRKPGGPKSVPGRSNSWDFLLLVQQWAPGVCDTETEHQCNIPGNVNSWTLHGLWPNNNDGSYPSDCNASEPYDPSQVSSIQSEMNQYWPDLFTSNDPNSFWSHEWDKHGTCAQSLPLLDTQLRFFTQALSLRSEYDVLKALSASGITPSSTNTYSGSQLSDAVSNAIGFSPLLQCEYSGSLGGKAVVQMALCIDKNLQVFSCPQAVQSKGIGKPCYSNDQIYYPPLN